MRYFDIDGVVADTYPHLFSYLGLPTHEPEIYYDPRFKDALKAVEKDWDFWLSIPVLHRPNTPPTAYITHRIQPNYITEKWIAIRGLFHAPVITLAPNIPKSLYMDEEGWIVDDNPHVYEEVTAAGKTCYLLDYKYNRHIDAPTRIFSLAELP